ncbi:hypothetical protein [Comamonas guangdongensis]|uniref:hypothetical protein n=1 Tax=Comamonas guangdongensis TaxID=510515 RepID=UPI0034E28707
MKKQAFKKISCKSMVCRTAAKAIQHCPQACLENLGTSAAAVDGCGLLSITECITPYGY